MEHVESGTRRVIGSAAATGMKSTAFLFEKGDVLYGRLRPYLNKVTCTQFRGLCSSEFIVLPPGPGVDSSILRSILAPMDLSLLPIS